MTGYDLRAADMALARYRLRAILWTLGMFVAAVVAECVLLVLIGVRYTTVGVVVGTGAWAAYGAWRVLHARPEPVRRRSKGLPATAWVATFALIPVANAHPALGLGLPVAAIFALGFAQPLVVIMARRRLRREPALLVNNTITANALYHTQFPEPGIDESV